MPDFLLFYFMDLLFIRGLRCTGPPINGASGFLRAPSSCGTKTSPVATLVLQPEACMKSTSPFPNPAFLNDAADKLSALLKQSPAKDIEQNLKAGLTSMLGKLDLVTREEFDVQAAVLARTREKLAVLEARLAKLESQAEPEKQRTA